MQLLDTNILIRYLVGDHPAHLVSAKKYFQEAIKGKRQLILDRVVIQEACYVLESNYGFNREKIAKALSDLVASEYLQVESRVEMLKTLEYYSKNNKFVDSYLLAKAEIDGLKILTFDEKLTKKLAKA